MQDQFQSRFPNVVIPVDEVNVIRGDIEMEWFTGNAVWNFDIVEFFVQRFRLLLFNSVDV